MSNLQITIEIPSDLVELAEALDYEITPALLTPDLLAILREQLKRKQAWGELLDAADKLRGSLTLEEIEETLVQAKTDRIAAAEHSAQTQ